MPSTSKKQQRFMGAELARKRAGKKTQTGMSKQQLSEFAGSVHGSLEDITFHEQAAESTYVRVPFYGEDGQEGHVDIGDCTDIQCSRDAYKHGQKDGHKIPVDYFGPDTDYRAEELDPHQYGKDWEPIPLRDYFKSEEKVEERGFRMREEDENFETPTPGTVTDSISSSNAYGAVPSTKINKHRDVPDYRSFESQKEFARAVTKAPERGVEISGIDTKKGSKIR